MTNPNPSLTPHTTGEPAWYRQVFEKIPAALLIVQADTGKLVDANAAALAFYGWPRDELLARTALDLAAPSEAPAAPFPAALEDRSHPLHHWHRLAGGNVCPVDLSAYPLLPAGGDLLCVEIRHRSETTIQHIDRPGGVAETAGGAAELVRLFDQILVDAAKVVSYTAAEILLIEGPEVRVAAHRGYRDQARQAIESVRFTLDETRTLYSMARSRRPIVINDVREYPGWIAVNPMTWERSYLGAPIQIEGQVIGFFALLSDRESYFTIRHADQLQAFANQAALAIQTTHLYEAERKQRALAEALRRTMVAISSALDLDGVLDAILDNIVQVVPHDAASLKLLHQGIGRSVRHRGYAERGLAEWLENQDFNLTEIGVWQDIVNTRRPLLVHDTHSHPQWVVFSETAWIRSALAAAIIVENEVIGFLHLESARPGAFTEDDGERLQVFADQAAVAIHNARLYESERRQLRLSQTLQEVGALLTAQMSLEDVLDRILDLLAQVVSFDSVSIQLLDETGRLGMVVGRGFPDPDYAREIAGQTLLDTLSERWVGRDVLLIADTENDPRWIGDERINYIRSWIGAALRVKGQIIGVLNVDNRLPGAYDEQTARTVGAFANQAAAAIENARLYAESQRRNRQLETLNRITRIGTATLDAPALRQALANAAAELIGGDACFITRLDAENNQVIPVAASDFLHYSYIQNEPVKAGEPSLTFAALRSGEPLALVDMPGSVYAAQASVEGVLFHSALALPLQADGRDLGALIIAFYEEHEFTGEEVAWAQQAADLYALAIVKAEAYTSLEQRVAARTAELQAANEQLTLLGEIKDEFVANVSHELRTPIASLKLYHHLLVANPGKQDIYLDRLQRETDRLELIIEDLLYLSRMDQGEMPVNHVELDVNGFISQLILDRQLLAQRHDLTLTFEPAGDLPLISGDTKLLGRAVSVLLTNALNYTPAGGVVTVRTDTARGIPDGGVLISVLDTGPGIPQKERSQVFDRFFRGQAARDLGTPGTGLGLAIAREIVERHSGVLRLCDRPDHAAGACFEIWLPAQAGS
jgi:PAS domain S-box-containing protein